MNLQLLLLSINVDIRATENISNHRFSEQVSILDKHIIYLQSPLHCVNKTAASYIHNYLFSIYSQLPFHCISVLQLHYIFTITTSQCVNNAVYIHNHHFPLRVSILHLQHNTFTTSQLRQFRNKASASETFSNKQ